MRPDRLAPPTADDPADDCGDTPCLGYAFYAPPGAVPRARLFPSGPVSADAVLLTSMGSSTAAPWRGAAGIRAPTACRRA